MLPAPMRGAASLGYLLARSSDTLADAVAAPLAARLHWLDQFEKAVAGKGAAPRWPLSLLNATGNPCEKRLLESVEDLLVWLEKIPSSEAELVREVVTTIISGQRLDLERFSNASSAKPTALADDGILENYAWRVAGCVGEFWTKLGFLTLADRFSNTPQDELLKLGGNYGKGLQLVNILRDLPDDLAAGRCYLPVAEPSDRVALLTCHREWQVRAVSWVADGKDYARRLSSRRLRAASVLPALLAEKTLDRLATAGWDELQTRIKIPRSEVYRSLMMSWVR